MSDGMRVRALDRIDTLLDGGQLDAMLEGVSPIKRGMARASIVQLRAAIAGADVDTVGNVARLLHHITCEIVGDERADSDLGAS